MLTSTRWCSFENVKMRQTLLALLDPLSSSVEGGEFKIFKGFGREAGLFVATLTASFVYTDSDTQWERLHESDGIRCYEPDPAAEKAFRIWKTINSRHSHVRGNPAPRVES